MEHLDKEIKTLQDKIKVSHKETAERRQEYLLDQANIATDNDDHARATSLKQISNSERRAEAYRHLKYNRTDTSIRRKITRLEVPNLWPTDAKHYEEGQQLDDPKKVTESEGWKTIHCPKEI